MIELQTMPLRFRVWDKEEECFVKYPTSTRDAALCIDQEGRLYWVILGNPGYAEAVDANRFIISQDTGLVDKNGKHIFTGDIVKLGLLYLVVEYLHGHIQYRPADEDCPLSLDAHELAIFGSIFENPVLLEG